jgi:hypothetical protein
MAEAHPHVENCPGCVADKLADEDRQYLRSTGWADPDHVFAPKPRMAPPKASDVPTVFWFFVAVGALIAVVAFLNAYPTFTLITAGVAIALWSWHRYIHKAQHDRDGQSRPSCGICRREDRRKAEVEWARYRMLIAKDADRREAEAHAANYARLRAIEAEQERLRREQGRV